MLYSKRTLILFFELTFLCAVHIKEMLHWLGPNTIEIFHKITFFTNLSLNAFNISQNIYLTLCEALGIQWWKKKNQNNAWVCVSKHLCLCIPPGKSKNIERKCQKELIL